MAELRLCYERKKFEFLCVGDGHLSMKSFGLDDCRRFRQNGVSLYASLRTFSLTIGAS